MGATAWGQHVIFGKPSVYLCFFLAIYKYYINYNTLWNHTSISIHTAGKKLECPGFFLLLLRLWKVKATTRLLLCVQDSPAKSKMMLKPNKMAWAENFKWFELWEVPNHWQKRKQMSNHPIHLKKKWLRELPPQIKTYIYIFINVITSFIDSQPSFTV